MSRRHHTADRDGPSENEQEDVETIELGEDGVVLYDGENLQAWLQSDSAVSLDGMR
jgi:AMMECR1 domain-containing protein